MPPRPTGHGPGCIELALFWCPRCELGYDPRMDSAIPPPPVVPEFDVHGNLPAGDYSPSRVEFETRFVHVNGSTTRTTIYTGFVDYHTELSAMGVRTDAPCMLNGSYTTHKVDPGDMDIVTEVESATLGAMDTTKAQEVFGGPKAKGRFHCDAYCIPVFPTNAPEYQTVTMHLRAYWNKWFGRDRQGRTKGKVWATVGGFK